MDNTQTNNSNDGPPHPQHGPYNQRNYPPPPQPPYFNGPMPFYPPPPPHYKPPPFHAPPFNNNRRYPHPRNQPHPPFHHNAPPPPFFSKPPPLHFQQHPHRPPGFPLHNNQPPFSHQSPPPHQPQLPLSHNAPPSPYPFHDPNLPPFFANEPHHILPFNEGPPDPNFNPHISPPAPTNPPEYWGEYKSKEGAIFYYNSKTKVSVWEKPADYDPFRIKPTKPSSWTVLGDTDWRKVHTENLLSYYYNVITKEATWEFPEELRAPKKEEVSENQTAENESESESEESEEENEMVEVQKDDGIIIENSEQNVSEKKSESKITPSNATSTNNKEMTHEEKVKIFRTMLEEAPIKLFSTWEKELPKFVFDSRFKILSNHGERREIFESFMREKNMKGKIESHQKKDAEKPQATNIEEKKVTEEPKKTSEDKEKSKEKAISGFKELLSSTTGIVPASKWIDIKKTIDVKDPRYTGDGLLNSSDRENLFNEFRDQLPEDPIAKKKRLKAEREEAALKARAQQVQKERESDVSLKNVERNKNMLKREEQVALLKTLYVERVKNPEISWREARSYLEKEERYQNIDLSSVSKESIYKEHINSLLEQRCKEFKTLLQSTLSITPSSTWSSSRSVLSRDPRYQRLSSEKLKVEVFESHLQELKKQAIEDFRQLLKETKKIMNTTQHTPDLIMVLKLEPRSKIFDAFPEERDKLI
eukprot:TRINITY_DN4081_c0_g1_i1.p1 TRINITY_DN4081_c0_g1~~TRINITY_DN4081_c0_g1_i1.p1  ORF type:complete len:703 (-),score=205.05 TRINITY_DN4081_c0_g1_i1:95-2203(-)